MPGPDVTRGLTGVAAIALALLLWPCAAAAQQTFYPDDPLTREPAPVPTAGPERRGLSDALEFFGNLLGDPGERQPTRGVIPAGGTNTLDEVLDGPWFQNRHAARRLTTAQLRRGAGDASPPSRERPWRALTARKYDVRPGILVADARNQMYLLRFDPPGRLEMSTGAEMVTSRVLHAIGYNVPEDYLVYFTRDQLEVSADSGRITSAGRQEALTDLDLDFFLADVASDPVRGYRAVATRIDPAWKSLLGPYQVYGTRTDDPNDIVPHEHRRDLRGLFVISAWLNHHRMRAVNTFDILVEDDGVPFIRHYLLDFFATLGAGEDGQKEARDGRESPLRFGQAVKHAIGFGLYTPDWMRASHPDAPAIGHLDFETFDPETWTPNQDIAPFANRLPDDDFWGARQVMAFTDADIHALVATGEYSDPEAAAWIERCLRERRDSIGRAYFSKVVPLDRFRIDAGTLAFDDLAVEHGFAAARQYGVRWLRVDNASGQLTRLDIDGSFELPRIVREAPAGAYFAARIWIDDPETHVTVTVRTTAGGADVVGVQRAWPGKVLADVERDTDTGESRFRDLTTEQQRLFEPYARAFNERSGTSLTPQQYFDSMTVSERTTYYAVTHALFRSPLTDASGASLGTAADLVAGIDRVAGQYYGRSGDQQFRLYISLQPDAEQVLMKSTQFRVGEINTVYHAGFPRSYRQDGKEPTIQFSVSDDARHADIDVDYRSSHSPQALFNGHLTSANSDVRAGDNADRHNARWSGLITWWKDLFGKLPVDNTGPTDAFAERPEPPTPTPPDRPRGARIPEIADTAQEFLTDWAVRRDTASALDFVSPNLYACMNVDDAPGDDALQNARAIEHLREIMRYAVAELGTRRSLTDSVDAAPPVDPKWVVVEQPFSGEFALVKMTPAESAPYLCGGQAVDPAGEYYGVLFRFKKKGAAVLGLLWQRQGDAWRIVAYRAFEQ